MNLTRRAHFHVTTRSTKISREIKTLKVCINVSWNTRIGGWRDCRGSW
jgi:hypothetical protein